MQLVIRPKNEAEGEPAGEHMNWEYQALRLEDLGTLIQDLNVLGADGWEVVSVIHSSDIETFPMGMGAGSVQQVATPKWTAVMKRGKS